MARYQYDDERYFVETGRTHNYVAMRPAVFGIVSFLALIGVLAIITVILV